MPKWALQVGGVSLLERSLGSCVPLLEAGFVLRLVALREHEGLLVPLLERSGVSCEVVLLDGVPAGQARSAVAGLEGVDGGLPVVVWNIDMQLLPEAFVPGWPVSGDWLLLAELEGDCWSFASVRDGLVTETAEKRRISELASVGMYGFASVGALRGLVEAEGEGAGELFLAPLYNVRVASGVPVVPVTVPAGAVVPFGTPGQLLASCARLGVGPPVELS